MTKQKPMTGTQARILTTLADQLDTYDNPQARARAAGIRGRLTLTPRISHQTARALATNAAIHIQELDLTLRAAQRREEARA